MKTVKAATLKVTPKKEKRGISKIVLTGVGLIICFFAVLTVLGNSPFALIKSINAEKVSQPHAVIGSAGGTYFGPVLEMIYSGNGKFQYFDGGIYEGNFEDSKRSGYGTFTWANGDTFSGRWSKDNMVSGTYTFADGRSYEGSFSNNSFYTGSFHLNTTFESNGLTKCTAEYVKGKISSLNFQTSKGMKYDGKVTGRAKITYENGDSYFGSVKNGSRDGEGTYEWYTNGIMDAHYEGKWSSGTMSGTGIYHYTKFQYPYIRGTFVDGKPDGKAVYYKSASNIFNTIWSSGVCQTVTKN